MKKNVDKLKEILTEALNSFLIFEYENVFEETKENQGKRKNQ